MAELGLVSSPTGFSSEIGVCEVRRILDLLDVMSSSSAISPERRLAATLGAQLALGAQDLVQLSTTWTGMRIVRPLSARARATAWRIHQVAYVENLKPLR